MVMGVIKNIEEIIVVEKDHNEIKLIAKKILTNVNVRDYETAKVAALNLVNSIDKLKK